MIDSWLFFDMNLNPEGPAPFWLSHIVLSVFFVVFHVKEGIYGLYSPQNLIKRSSLAPPPCVEQLRQQQPHQIHGEA